MNAIILEAAIPADHKLHLELPMSLPTGARVRVTLESIPESGINLPSSADAPPRTPLWSRLAELRRQAEAAGALPAPLTWDEILAECSRRRGDEDV